MFSGPAKKIADACRFCWMCRHVCPVGLVTGKEADTPRGRALLVSMDDRNIPLDADAAGLMFECCLCAACTNDCVTGFDPPQFTREARQMAVANGLAPERLKDVAEGALAGAFYAGEMDRGLAEKIAALPVKGETVAYLGGNARSGSPESALGLLAVLEKAGIAFAVMRDEPESGAIPFDLLGASEEVLRAAIVCARAVLTTGAKTLVVLEPSHAAFMTHQWAEWGVECGARVVTATAFVAGLIESGRIAPGKSAHASAAFQDPCRLARDLEETEPARDILAAMGIRVAEMFLNRKLTKCCSGPILERTCPEIAPMVAAARWDEARETGAELLVTACPSCLANFSRAAPNGMAVRDIFALLAEACT